MRNKNSSCHITRGIRSKLVGNDCDGASWDRFGNAQSSGEPHHTCSHNGNPDGVHGPVGGEAMSYRPCSRVYSIQHRAGPRGFFPEASQTKTFPASIPCGIKRGPCKLSFHDALGQQGLNGSFRHYCKTSLELLLEHVIGK